MKSSLKVISNNSPAMQNAVDAQLKQIIKQATFGVEGHAKKNAPVDTGNLRNSIQSTVSDNGLRGEVTAHAEYAIYVEMGTVRTPAQPYMMPALRSVLPKLRSSLRAIGMRLR
jgi:HK97 gp10 family phage protein